MSENSQKEKRNRYEGREITEADEMLPIRESYDDCLIRDNLYERDLSFPEIVNLLNAYEESDNILGHFLIETEQMIVKKLIEAHKLIKGISDQKKEKKVKKKHDKLS